ncbi:MAG: hypothetical protein UDK36_06065 [Bacteroidaceae bacterium]|nr:hypothetical protein [Bacteroidaceae bacterium]
MKREEQWDKNYDEIIKFMLENKRRPSKHKPEDSKMLNWIKYTKKTIAKNKISESRLAKFKLLMELAERFRRKNQHAYLVPIEEDDKEQDDDRSQQN